MDMWSMKRVKRNNKIFKTTSIIDRAQEQVDAMNLLIAQGYTILDLEGNFLNKETLDMPQESYHGSRPRYDYVNIYQRKKKSL